MRADVHQAKGLLAHLTNKGISLNTQSVYLSALGKFYDEIMNTGFAPENGNIFRSPAVKLPRGARKPKEPSKAFTEREVERILSGVDNERDLAIMALLFGAGLRKSEMLGLTVHDLQERELIGVGPDGKETREKVDVLTLRHTKAHVLREHSIAPWVAKLVRRYIKGKKGRMFELSRTAVDKIFTKYVQKAGIEGKWSPHDARATGINIMIQQGVPLQHIQDFSRHGSVRMVEEYRRRLESIASNPGRQIGFGKFGNGKDGDE